MVTIRSATAADADAVLAIYAPIVELTPISFELEVPTVEEMATRISETVLSFPWLVAETPKGIAGYAYARPFRPRAAYRWSVETSVYVAESARGAGIARRLYDALLDGLREQGFVTAFAGITLPNPASVRLHEGVGFVQIGIFPSAGYKLGRWHDVGWWHLRLREPAPDPDEPRPQPPQTR
jgi:phosphinothricin acetyltransferase